jgi:hypothetical protein
MLIEFAGPHNYALLPSTSVARRMLL